MLLYIVTYPTSYIYVVIYPHIIYCDISSYHKLSSSNSQKTAARSCGPYHILSYHKVSYILLSYSAIKCHISSFNNVSYSVIYPHIIKCHKSSNQTHLAAVAGEDFQCLHSVPAP